MNSFAIASASWSAPDPARQPVAEHVEADVDASGDDGGWLGAKGSSPSTRRLLGNHETHPSGGNKLHFKRSSSLPPIPSSPQLLVGGAGSKNKPNKAPQQQGKTMDRTRSLAASKRRMA